MSPLVISSLAIIGFSALIHASFQLSVSVLTLLSGHSLGKKTAHRKLLGLMHSFVGGAFIMTTLLVSSATYYLGLAINHASHTEQCIATITCGLMAGLGVATWVFYYRRGDGTALWLPRNFAGVLSRRSRATRNSAEAFGLGLTSVAAELLFIIGPVLASALTVITLPSLPWQLAGIGLYILVSLMPLLIVVALVGSGHSIAQLQQWRVRHKRFMQFTAGASLIILAGFIFADRVLGITTYGGF